MEKKNAVNCKVCGATNASRTTKCKRCGFPLSEHEAAAKSTDDDAQSEIDEQESKGQIDVPYSKKETALLDSLNHTHLSGFFARLLLKPILHKIKPKFRATAINAAILVAVILTFSAKYFEKESIKKDESADCFISRNIYAHALSEEAAFLFNNHVKRIDANTITSRITTFYCNSNECVETRSMKLEDSCGNTDIIYAPGDNGRDYRILIDSDKFKTCKICITPRGVYPNTFGQCEIIAGAKCP